MKCPFPAAVNPHAEEINALTLEWVQHYEMVDDSQAFERICISKFGWLAARAYPNAPIDRLKLVSDWNTWLFVIDDQCDEWYMGTHPRELNALHMRCLEILSGERPVAKDVPLIHSLYDFRLRIEAMMPLDWFIRFIHSVTEYFESTVWEAQNRASHTWPNPRLYIQMRPYTGGLYTDIDLIELTEQLSLPMPVRKHPVLQLLMNITNNVVCWSNDIISLQKEHAHHDMHNLAMVLHHRNDISLQEAVNRVAKTTQQQIARFIAAEQRVPSFGGTIDRDVQQLISVLRSWMRGNIDWSYESGRYFPMEEHHPVNTQSMVIELST